MKIVSTVLKILAVLAVIAGIVYVVLTYRDKITAWVKKLLGKFGCCQCECDCDCDCECQCDCQCQEAVEETSEAAVAEEADFEG